MLKYFDLSIKIYNQMLFAESSEKLHFPLLAIMRKT